MYLSFDVLKGLYFGIIVNYRFFLNINIEYEVCIDIYIFVFYNKEIRKKSYLNK